ncbi:MAG: S41 family peptidase [Myxococcaceae bacterium]
MLLSFQVFVACAVAGTPPPTPSPWAAMAADDLKAIHEAVSTSHPGPVDPLNTGFREWLDQGLNEGLAAAARARTFGDYAAAVRRYVAGFRDGHLFLKFRVTHVEPRWMGFIISFRGGRYELAQVDAADSSLPPAGSELLDCDGVPPATLLVRDVFPYFGNPALEASRVAVTPFLLVDVGLPRSTVKACRASRSGRVTTFELHERGVDPQDLARRQNAGAFGPAPQMGVRPFGLKGVWVTLPSFDNSHAKALRSVVSQSPSWRHKEVVVFDLRGNTGGNSLWGERIAEGLWGKAHARARVAPTRRATFVDWRVSDANLKYLEAARANFASKLGPLAPDTQWAATNAERVRRGLAAHESLVREPPELVPAELSKEASSSYSGRVFFVTDGRCFSACLDFADVLLAFPKVVHVGQTTDADTLYMEVRTQELPSGISRLGLPMKVYRGRSRGHNVPLIPSHRYEGDISDTGSLETWLSTVLEKRSPTPSAR